MLGVDGGASGVAVVGHAELTATDWLGDWYGGGKHTFRGWTMGGFTCRYLKMEKTVNFI